jgi:hypothetical protein
MFCITCASENEIASIVSTLAFGSGVAGGNMWLQVLCHVQKIRRVYHKQLLNLCGNRHGSVPPRGAFRSTMLPVHCSVPTDPSAPEGWTTNQNMSDLPSESALCAKAPQDWAAWQRLHKQLEQKARALTSVLTVPADITEGKAIEALRV